jgi:hypothetical protein
VGLIFLTCFVTTSFYLWQQWRDEENVLRAQGRTVATMLAELSERGLQVDDRASINAVLDSMPAEGDIAYVAVLNADRSQIAERRFGDSLTISELPPPRLPTSSCKARGISN